MLPLALSCGPNSGDRKLCENEARSRAVEGAESRGVMEKSPLRKKRKRSTMDTTPQGFWSSSMQTSEVVFRCANMKKRQESVSCALTVSCVLNGWNCGSDGSTERYAGDERADGAVEDGHVAEVELDQVGALEDSDQIAWE